MNGTHLEGNVSGIGASTTFGATALRSQGQTAGGENQLRLGRRTRKHKSAGISGDGAILLARGLGWFSVGLGVTQLLAPRAVARAIGVGTGPTECLAMRAVGVRELMAGFGILKGSRPAPFLWSRVAGDLMDLALLTRALRSPWPKPGHTRGRIPGALLAMGGVTALDLLSSAQMSRSKVHGLPVTATATPPVEVSSFITIGRSPEEVYAFWRDFNNLSRFMVNVQSVQVVDHLHSHWTVAVAGKTLKWDAEITDDRAGERVAWRTMAKADVAMTGEVRFARAPGGRGTEVRVKLEVTPPAGLLGKAAVKLGRVVPEQQVANDLRRLKQVLEVGEVVQSDASVHKGPHSARPAAR